MVAKHDQKVAAEKEGKKKSASTKQPKPKPAIEKSSKPAHALKPKVTKEKPSKASTAKQPKSKLAKEKSTKATPPQKASKGKVAKVHNMKSSFQLVDEPDEEPAHSEPEPEQEGAGGEYDMDRSIQMSLESFQAQGHTHVEGVAIQEPVTEAIRPLPVVKGKEASTGPSAQPLDDTSANIIRGSPSHADAEIGARSDKTSRGGDTEIVHIEEDQAGPDPGISCVALAGLDPEPTHNEFMDDLYPKVQESLKFLADEHVILEDPLSSTGTLSPMKNLEDVYTIEDQFINDKSTDDEPGKLNVEAEAVSMVNVPIYQASSSVPPLTTESELVEHVTALEKKLSDLEQTNKNLDNTTRNLRSRVYPLKLRDMPHKIYEAVHENVKEAVQIALQAPLRDRLRDLSEEDMKEMLHQRMFKTGSYKSLPEHIAFYEDLEASIEHSQRDEFLTEKDKSRKRRCDDQDPSPPQPNSDQNAPSSSSKQQSGPHAEQPVDDIPIQDFDNISDSEDTDSAHLPKTKQRPEWLNPIQDDERPTTPEPACVIPTSHIPDVVNNWANALATTYQAST
ncbi:hypothetical protein Tco_0944944 [Tanacetum coccineum]